MLAASPFGDRRGRGPSPFFAGRRRRLLPETAALVARMTSPPGAERVARIEALIGALKEAGLWDALGILHVHAAHDAQASALNWKGAGFTAVPATTSPGATPLPVFTPDRGWQGDGAAAFLDLGAPYAAVPGVAMGSHCDLFWSRTATSSAGADAGATTTTTRYGSTATQLSVRADSGSTLVAAVGDSLGLYGFSRSGSDVLLVKNGVVLATATDAATALATGNVRTLAGGGQFGVRQCAARVVAPHVGAAGQAALHAALLAYLQGVGAA